jgi:hypothetical protein
VEQKIRCRISSRVSFAEKLEEEETTINIKQPHHLRIAPINFIGAARGGGAWKSNILST